jgi:hypothetical protein
VNGWMTKHKNENYQVRFISAKTGDGVDDAFHSLVNVVTSRSASSSSQQLLCCVFLYVCGVDD